MSTHAVPHPQPPADIRLLEANAFRPHAQRAATALGLANARAKDASEDFERAPTPETYAELITAELERDLARFRYRLLMDRLGRSVRRRP